MREKIKKERERGTRKREIEKIRRKAKGNQREAGKEKKEI